MRNGFIISSTITRDIWLQIIFFIFCQFLSPWHPWTLRCVSWPRWGTPSALLGSRRPWPAAGRCPVHTGSWGIEEKKTGQFSSVYFLVTDVCTFWTAMYPEKSETLDLKVLTCSCFFNCIYYLFEMLTKKEGTIL